MHIVHIYIYINTLASGRLYGVRNRFRKIRFRLADCVFIPRARDVCIMYSRQADNTVSIGIQQNAMNT